MECNEINLCGSFEQSSPYIHQKTFSVRLRADFSTSDFFMQILVDSILSLIFGGNEKVIVHRLEKAAYLIQN